MNILLVTPLYAAHHWDAGHFWLKALNALGHSVVVWDYRLNPQGIRLPEKAQPLQLDFTLVLKGESITSPERLPRPRVCYWPDALDRTPGIEKTLQHYDKVYTPVRPTPPGMVWLPTGWAPDIHRYTGAERDIPSLYIGTNNSERKVDFIMGIAPRVIAGNGWAELRGRLALHSAWSPHMDNVQVAGPAYLHDFVALASRAQVAINIHHGPVGLNRKGIELMACTFTITDRVPGMEEVLGDITEAVSFTTPEEGKALLERWLAEPAGIREEMWQYERERIAPFTYLRAAQRILG